MDVMDAVRLAAKRAGMGTTEIGPAMGKVKTYFSATASRGSIPKVDTVAAMLEACGYTLCAVPKGSEPKNAIIICSSAS